MRPDPALVVLVGASGAGKSYWAARHYRATEVVSSDALRAAVGSGPGDLDASVDAFDVLERVVAARLRRRLTVVVDTLGLDPVRRSAWREAAHAQGLPAVVVRVDTPATVCRDRNGARDRPVPAAVLREQLRRAAVVGEELKVEGWDLVEVVNGVAAEGDSGAGVLPAESVPPASQGTATGPTGIFGPPGEPPRVVLQLSRFPWGADPATWLRDIAVAADEAGCAGLALMDHLVQIPQVGRAWEPIPEPYVTLGLLAGLDTRLALGTLVTPVTFREPGVVAKSMATIDVLSGGRAFLGLGAGWWESEHAGHGIAFPTARQRLDLLERSIETARALWAAGSRPFAGQQVSLPDTTSYPRPVHDVPIVVGGTGSRTLRIAGRLADAVNVPSDEGQLAARQDAVRAAAQGAGRDPDAVATTVLDVAVVGHDREDVARRVERLRGRTAATTYAVRHHAGTPAAQAERYRRLGGLGVRTVFLALPDLESAADLDRVAPVTAALARG